MSKQEDRIQQEIYTWYQNNYCLKHHKNRCIIFHVPNQNQQHLVKIGVLPGVSDLIIIHYGKILFIEVKTPTGTQSDVQKEFQARITASGHPYHLVRSLDDLINTLQSYAS